jgi:uncharacterized metal-binding protein YceD (DUF177 family)
MIIPEQILLLIPMQPLCQRVKRKTGDENCTTSSQIEIPAKRVYIVM